MRRFILQIALTAALLLVGSGIAHALTCSASMSDVNFGSVSLRTGETNTTSGTVQINCSNALVSVVGVCVRFGDGSGGAGGGNSPRYMRNGSGNLLSYELRATGYGPPNSTWNNVYVIVPVVLGSGSVSLPVYADITATGVGFDAGSYSSVFSGSADARIDYGVASCDLFGDTATIPDFSVSADVTSSCEVDSASLDFGNISDFLNSAVDAQTDITVRCTAATDYSIRLGLGTGAGATGPEDRKMSYLTNTISYGLYQDAARSIPWGNTAANDQQAQGTGADQLFPVYGRIFAGQTAPAGTYSDSVIITVEYD